MISPAGTRPRSLKSVSEDAVTHFTWAQLNRADVALTVLGSADAALIWVGTVRGDALVDGRTVLSRQVVFGRATMEVEWRQQWVALHASRVADVPARSGCVNVYARSVHAAEDHVAAGVKLHLVSLPHQGRRCCL